jgi:hypothetical protein
MKEDVVSAAQQNVYPVGGEPEMTSTAINHQRGKQQHLIDSHQREPAVSLGSASDRQLGALHRPGVIHRQPKTPDANPK